MEEGEYVTVIGGYSGLYQDEDGEICKVDNTLTPETVSLFTANGTDGGESIVYRNRAGESTVLLPQKMGDGAGFLICVGDYMAELVPGGGIRQCDPLQ